MVNFIALEVVCFRNLTICWKNSVSDSTRKGNNLLGGVNQQERVPHSGTILRDYMSNSELNRGRDSPNLQATARQ